MTNVDLIELRQRFRWTQAEAAARLGCSKRSISNWEKGVHEIPEYIALAAAAVCMNLPPYCRRDD
jgi:transcriptional regulator with XRE-family HTH domain